jgi:hypothetical protein
MQYELYFGALKIGNVFEDDRDFPSWFGRITYAPSFEQSESELARRLARFIGLSFESIALIDANQEGSPELADLLREEAAFNDVADSKAWHLIDELGSVIPILCPVLRRDGGIVWRWNPEISPKIRNRSEQS